MKDYNRKAIFSELNENMCGKGAFVEVTEWINKEGFDVLIETNLREKFSIDFYTWGVLKKMVKKLDEQP